MEENSIGSILKKEREIKGLTHEKVAEDLKIRTKFVECMEKENFGQLPGEVYVKAFLRSYAEYLGINADEIISIYTASKEEKKEPEIPLHHPLMIKDKKRKKIRFTIEMKIGILAVLGLVLIYSLSVSVRSCANLPSSREVINREITTTLPPLILDAEVTQDECWVEIIKDNEAPLKLLMKTGDKKSWQAKEEFNLLVGNKDNIKLSLNGKAYDISKRKTRDGVLRDLIIKREVNKDAK